MRTIGIHSGEDEEEGYVQEGGVMIRALTSDDGSDRPASCGVNNAQVEETLCVQARNATALKTLITPTPNTTHTNPQVCWGILMQ